MKRKNTAAGRRRRAVATARILRETADLDAAEAGDPWPKWKTREWSKWMKEYDAARLARQADH